MPKPTWTKQSDFLPLANAKAQVEYFKQDLINSENALKWALSFGNKKWKGYQQQIRILQKDVKDSKINLAKAYLKLAESEKLE